MPKNEWTDDIAVLLNIHVYRQQNIEWNEVFKLLQAAYSQYHFTSPDSVRKRFSNCQFKIESLLPDITPVTESYEEAYDKLCYSVGKYEKVAAAQTRKASSCTKNLVISDWHIPFHNQELSAKIIAEHKDADRCIIPGDFLDCYSVSRFTKRLEITLKEEIVAAMAVVDMLASKFPEIVILEGNHTDRVRKHFESRIERDLMFLVKYDILELLCSPYKNIRVVKDHYEFGNGNGEAIVSYFTKVGHDCLVGHFETSSKIPVKAAHNAYLWLNSWSKHFNLGEIRLFLQGHTHRLSKYPLDDGCTTIGETGCVAKIQDYAVDSGAKYSAHVNGYWVVYQENGYTDVNRSNFFVCR